MQTTNHTTIRQLGAVLKNEYNSNYCRTNANFTNGGAAAVQLQPGVLFTGGTTPAVFDTAAVAVVTGVCVTSELVRPGATVAVTYLSVGPGILNSNEIDFPVDAGQRATIETAIRAMSFKLVAGLDT